uniref:Protein arginine methyltransferase NDUFAF7 n=1 Tax=Vombatus ursinus TaxID=29139 RepID=A0A4X2K2E4_VOMUR
MSVLLKARARLLLPAQRAVIPFLWKVKYFSSGKESAESNPVTPMLRHLTYKIKATGPITVAEYMKEVLTNPAKLLGIWCISEWMATGKSSTFQLVELGPGRGTLTGDILRVFSQLGSVLKNCDISVHLVEKTPQGWREVFVDIDPQDSDKLRFVLAPSPTPAETFIQPKETRDHVEVCPDAGVIIQILSERIEESGGAALIADYGHDGTKMDTFRGFCGHKLHDVLIAPGTADLTADVDFSYLRRMTQGKVASLGPIQQHNFFKNMGIDVRLKVLLDNSSDTATRQQLIRGYDMLMNPKKMGERFNFFALLPHRRLSGGSTCQSKSLPSPVAGFGDLVWK